MWWSPWPTNWPALAIVDTVTGKVRDLFAGTLFHLLPQEPEAALFDISPDPREFSFTDIVAMEVKSGKTTTLTQRDKALARFACGDHATRRWQNRAWQIDHQHQRQDAGLRTVQPATPAHAVGLQY